MSPTVPAVKEEKTRSGHTKKVALLLGALATLSAMCWMALAPVAQAQGGSVKPTRMEGTLTGTLNGRTVNATLLFKMNHATGEAEANLSNITPDLGPTLLQAISVGTLAGPPPSLETGGALNGSSLFRGNLVRDNTIVFDTGHSLNIHYTASYPGTGDVIKITGRISGNAPELPLGVSVSYPGWDDEWTQIAPNQIRMTGARPYSVNGGAVRSATHTSVSTYDGARQMPFPQKRIVRNVVSRYDPATLLLYFAEQNTVAPLTDGTPR